MANKNPSEPTRFKPGNKARRVDTPKRQISIRLPPELIEYAESIGNNRSDGVEKALKAHKETSIKSEMEIQEFETATGHEFNPTKQFMDKLPMPDGYTPNHPANQFTAVQWRGTTASGKETFLLNWKHGGRQNVNVAR